MQLANEQAQSLEASLAAEERIQALEQRLASHQDSGTADQTAAGDPPAMAAPGTVHPLAVCVVMCSPYGCMSDAVLGVVLWYCHVLLGRQAVCN